MAFGFYQDEGIGLGCFSWTGPDFYRECIWDGPNTPVSSPHYTQWTGFYVTRELAIGGAAGFIWNLDGDYGTGLSPKYRIRLSGEYLASYTETPTYAVSYSGGFSVLVTDSGTYSGRYTGEVASGLFDVPTFSGRYTGYCESGLQDSPNFSGSFSGNYASGISENLAVYSWIMTGECRPKNWDKQDYSINISGGLTQRITGGSGWIGFAFDTFTYELITNKLSRGISGSGNMGFQISSFGYRFTEV